jgi:hypothetical protein
MTVVTTSSSERFRAYLTVDDQVAVYCPRLRRA